jgi:hypothetical protein
LTQLFDLFRNTYGYLVAVILFSGNTADPPAVASQMEKLRDSYGIGKIAWTGRPGMLTQALIDTVLRRAGVDCVSSLRSPQMSVLAQEKRPFQPILFDERNLLEVTNQAFPARRWEK